MKVLTILSLIILTSTSAFGFYKTAVEALNQPCITVSDAVTSHEFSKTCTSRSLQVYYHFCKGQNLNGVIIEDPNLPNSVYSTQICPPDIISAPSPIRVDLSKSPFVKLLSITKSHPYINIYTVTLFILFIIIVLFVCKLVINTTN